MPSASLTFWTDDRMPRLDEVDGQCAASLGVVPGNPRLVDENIRGFVLLLSAHFQGYCRDLYTECAQVVATKVRPSLQTVVQQQFTAVIALDRGNPNVENIVRDFNRFGFKLNFPVHDPANHARLVDLKKMNDWRNIAAHHGKVPPEGPPSLAAIRAWRDSCDGLAASLDEIMYSELRGLLRRPPWSP